MAVVRHKEAIHSGQFMVSDFEAEAEDEEDIALVSPGASPKNDHDPLGAEKAVSSPRKKHKIPMDSADEGGSDASPDKLRKLDHDHKKYVLSTGILKAENAPASAVKPSKPIFRCSKATGIDRYCGTKRCVQCEAHKAKIVDVPLNKLLQSMSIAYRQNLTSPKWNRFRGLRLRWKDKIRLNNVIWRCWHQQFVKGKANKLLCQFANPLEIDHHKDIECSTIVPGKYWKRKMETIKNEYMRWRCFLLKEGSGEDSKPLSKLVRSASFNSFDKRMALQKAKNKWDRDKGKTSPPKGRKKTGSRSGTPNNVSATHDDLDKLDLDLILKSPFTFVEGSKDDCALEALLVDETFMADALNANDKEIDAAANILANNSSSGGGGNPLLDDDFTQQTIAMFDMGGDDYKNPTNSDFIIPGLPSLQPNLDEIGIVDFGGNVFSGRHNNQQQQRLEAPSKQPPQQPQAPEPHQQPEFVPGAAKMNASAAILPSPYVKIEHERNTLLEPRTFHPSPHFQARQTLLQAHMHSGHKMKSPKHRLLRHREYAAAESQPKQPDFRVPPAAAAGSAAAVHQPFKSGGGSVFPPQASRYGGQIHPPNPELVQLLKSNNHAPFRPPPMADAKSAPADLSNKPVFRLPASPAPPATPPSPLAHFSLDPDAARLQQQQIMSLTEQQWRSRHFETERQRSLMEKERRMLENKRKEIEERSRLEGRKIEMMTSQLKERQNQLEQEWLVEEQSLLAAQQLAKQRAALLESQRQQMRRHIPPPRPSDVQQQPLLETLQAAGVASPASPAMPSSRRRSEQHRRSSVKSGFDALRDLIPSLNTGDPQTDACKISKAALLKKGGDHLKELKAARARNAQEIKLKKEAIARLNAEIGLLQSELPMGGKDRRRRHDLAASSTRSTFVDYSRQCAVKSNWKHWVFAHLVGPLAESFDRTVGHVNLDQTESNAKVWIDQSCSLPNLRAVLTEQLRKLAVETRILYEPENFAQEIVCRAARVSRDPSALSTNEYEEQLDETDQDN